MAKKEEEVLLCNATCPKKYEINEMKENDANIHSHHFHVNLTFLLWAYSSGRMNEEQRKKKKFFLEKTGAQTSRIIMKNTPHTYVLHLIWMPF